MRFPPTRIAIFVALATTAMCAACSADAVRAEPEGLTPPGLESHASTGSPAGRHLASEADSAPATSPSGMAPAQPADLGQSTADSFRAFVETLDEPDPDVVAFVADSTDDRLNGLAVDACALIEPDMSPAELGAAVLVTHDRHRLTEQIGADPFSLVFGALAGLHCPEHLPVGGQRIAAIPDQPTWRDEWQQWWPADHPVAMFLDSLDANRLEQLGVQACAQAPESTSPEAFGWSAAAHRDTALTADERVGLSPGDHAELYGALIGWFCPARLPTIG